MTSATHTYTQVKSIIRIVMQSAHRDDYHMLSREQ